MVSALPLQMHFYQLEKTIAIQAISLLLLILKVRHLELEHTHIMVMILD